MHGDASETLPPLHQDPIGSSYKLRADKKAPTFLVPWCKWLIVELHPVSLLEIHKIINDNQIHSASSWDIMGYPSNHLRKSTCSQKSFTDLKSLVLWGSHCYSREVPALMIVFVTPIVNLEKNGVAATTRTTPGTKFKWTKLAESQWTCHLEDWAIYMLKCFHVFPHFKRFLEDPIFMNEWPTPGSVMFFSSICVHPALLLRPKHIDGNRTVTKSLVSSQDVSFRTAELWDEIPSISWDMGPRNN